MSRGALTWSLVPVDPEPLGAAGDNLEWLLLKALNLGDPFEQTSADSLCNEPAELVEGTPAALYLQGALDGLPASELRTDYGHELSELLAELKARGCLQIRCSR